MYYIVGRNLCHCTRHIAKDLGKQFKVEVHVYRLTCFGVADTFQHERETTAIEVRIETGIAIERANVKFVRIFERNFGLSG
jgi:hypothetical protein